MDGGGGDCGGGDCGGGGFWGGDCGTGHHSWGDGGGHHHNDGGTFGYIPPDGADTSGATRVTARKPRTSGEIAIKIASIAIGGLLAYDGFKRMQADNAAEYNDPTHKKSWTGVLEGAAGLALAVYGIAR